MSQASVLCGAMVLASLSSGCGQEAAVESAREVEALDAGAVAPQAVVRVLPDLHEEPLPVGVEPADNPEARQVLDALSDLQAVGKGRLVFEELRKLPADEVAEAARAFDAEEHAALAAWLRLIREHSEGDSDSLDTLQIMGRLRGEAGVISGTSYPAAWLAPDEVAPSPEDP